MTTGNTDMAQHGLRELTTDELEQVDGGVLPILLAAFFVGFDLGLWTTLAIRRLS